MSGEITVQVVVDHAAVVISCEDVGYSPDVIDDMRVRALDSMHQLLHMRGCGEHDGEGMTLEQIIERMQDGWG